MLLVLTHFAARLCT